MQQSQSLFWAKMTKLITEDKLNCIEEVTFSRSISAHDHVVLGAEGIHDGLVPVAPEALDDDLPGRRVGSGRGLQSRAPAGPAHAPASPRPGLVGKRLLRGGVKAEATGFRARARKTRLSGRMVPGRHGRSAPPSSQAKVPSERGDPHPARALQSPPRQPRRPARAGRPF